MNNNYHYKENNNILWKDYSILINSLEIDKTVLKKLNKSIIKNDLQIIFLILAHDKRPDLESITNSIKLINKITLDNIHIALSFQGKIEKSFNNVIFINNHVSLSIKTGINLTSGKSENMLVGINELNKLFHNKENRTFIITIDSDYILYDYVNLILLFTPWVFSFCEDEYKDVQFVKASGLFINIKDLFSRTIPKKEMLSFQNIIEKYKKENLDKDICTTPKNLNLIFSNNEIKELKNFLSSRITIGGRIAKAFDMQKVILSDTIYGKNLNKIRSILHGNQGTTLANWNHIPFVKGYGLELSFIFEFLYNKHFDKLKLVDCEILPLSHKTKSDNDSLTMGIKLFSIVKSYYDFSEQKSRIEMDINATNHTDLFDVEMIKITLNNELDLLPSYNKSILKRLNK
ncbi:hypothetical protein [Parabacteroides distasonis]|uniref:Uncharacterized protein n=1 Tax=Parabacteroides distasonis TaxID=823 RepID=A0A174VUD8_PARDI|nr:hypothetical protein [Parabacteroides distasonis]MRY84855.1 hypothetical protein [Parabacteroides distasonis]MRZ06680.1 hypothetical protein [Parabacteroides distasonis]CUQ35640.1 Uncharacterised protein [Parabacteroides distasonis]